MSWDPAGRALTYVWSSPSEALQALATTAGSVSRLVLSAEAVAALLPGTYTLTLSATNWLGATGVCLQGGCAWKAGLPHLSARPPPTTSATPCPRPRSHRQPGL